MAWNLFPSMLALDETTGDVARNAVGQVYAPEDLTRSTPLPVQDATGVPLASTTSNRLGVVQRFRVENRKSVVWKSGPYEVDIVSIEAIIADVNLATAAAAASATAAAASATAATAAAAAQDSVVASYVSSPGSATNTAVISVAGSAGGGGAGDVSVDTLAGATAVGKDVMKAVDKPAARLAIGAGTSSLVIGVLGTDAAAGNDVLRLTGTSPQKTTRPTEFAGGITLGADAIPTSTVANLDELLAAAATPAGVVFQTEVYKMVRRSGANVDGAWPTTRPTGNWLGMEWLGADPDPSVTVMAAGDLRDEVL